MCKLAYAWFSVYLFCQIVAKFVNLACTINSKVLHCNLDYEDLFLSLVDNMMPALALHCECHGDVGIDLISTPVSQA